MKVFITGASSGIGEALARHYAAQGATLGLLARRQDHLAALKRSLSTPVETYSCDVRDLKAVRDAAVDFMTRQGVPDVVVGNAGVSHGTLTEYAEDAETFRHILDINVMGLVHTFHPFVGPMRSRGSGALVGIASVAGYRGLPGASAYSASKAAAIRYCEALRVELHGCGVQVTTICPGYIATPMTQKNPYPMPFIIPADEFARRCVRDIAAGKTYSVIPWQMGLVAKLLVAMPNFLFDRLAAKAGRKPRK